jgi:pyruvate,water dikinase
MWSLYDHVWQDALNGFLRDIKLLGKREDDFQAGRMFYGRPYWNVGKVKDCMAKLPGFVEKDFDADLQIRVDPNSEGRVTPVTPLGVLRALPTVLAVPAMWKRQARFDHDFLDGGFEKLVSRFEDKIKDPTESFGQLIEEAFTVTELNYFRTIFCASLAKLDFAEAFPEATSTALIGGIPDIRHLEPVRAMREMKARGEKDLSLLMKRFRHHSRNELDLRAPRWDEDPEWIEQMWDNLPPDSGDRPKAAYTEALSRELQCLPKRQHRRFLKKLNRLRHFLWLREEMRDLSTQMYYLIRKHVLAIAEERNLGDDVFFMTWKEIVAMDCSSIAAARATFESYRNFKAPNEIGRPFTANIEAASSGEFTGIAASPGVTQGPVAIARDVTEAMGAPAGSILVCPFTDPGWTSVLGKVAAVVTENGGQLSHAAVICREFGIPAVLGVGDATLRLKDGHFVTVDGDHGKIITH